MVDGTAGGYGGAGDSPGVGVDGYAAVSDGGGDDDRDGGSEGVRGDYGEVAVDAHDVKMRCR